MTGQEQHEKTATRFGFYIAGMTAVVTIVTFIIAFMTPPMSGPYCAGPCYEYPYTDIASRFPRDYFWMYPAMLVSLLYLVLMICIHEYAIREKKLFGRIGMSLAMVATAILVTDYYLQVTVIQPGLLNRETDGLALLTQFNPHGIFIALEEIGFLLMSLSFFSIVPVFPGKTGLGKAVRITYITGFVLAVLSLILVSLKYGVRRDYLFEIIIISIVWFELIISSILLSVLFRRTAKG